VTTTTGLSSTMAGSVTSSTTGTSTNRSTTSTPGSITLAVVTHSPIQGCTT